MSALIMQVKCGTAYYSTIQEPGAEPETLRLQSAVKKAIWLVMVLDYVLAQNL
ncbi:MAG: hypothetical protein HWQ41_17400 [Nostoc sp. NOS(2021)]|uniref:hypothetical protein n=1 Tax=Nostoc sp. NOS(2021) TaxID=2815407 RepID=UPI0025FEF28E|nr:hypothetical protein [Nostoc sp. NOS(2021)]MBN3896978.1 hypothetical protein [Nostoc sp. NOS(2021)]